MKGHIFVGEQHTLLKRLNMRQPSRASKQRIRVALLLTLIGPQVISKCGQYER